MEEIRKARETACFMDMYLPEDVTLDLRNTRLHSCVMKQTITLKPKVVRDERYVYSEHCGDQRIKMRDNLIRRGRI
ncbi:MAG: hypothetical protein K6T51_09885 [Rubrobacteraceae bacterium]|nr:hypothetical protein [Rubrobacteraceae bacterium]